MGTATIMTFGSRLRDLRQGRGWTQQQLAERAGLPVGTLRNLEQGSRSPSWESVVRLARAFDANSAIFDDCDEVAPEPEEEPKPRRRGKGGEK